MAAVLLNSITGKPAEMHGGGSVGCVCILWEEARWRPGGGDWAGTPRFWADCAKFCPLGCTPGFHTLVLGTLKLCVASVVGHLDQKPWRWGHPSCARAVCRVLGWAWHWGHPHFQTDDGHAETSTALQRHLCTWKWLQCWTLSGATASRDHWLCCQAVWEQSLVSALTGDRGLDTCLASLHLSLLAHRWRIGVPFGSRDGVSLWALRGPFSSLHPHPFPGCLGP